MQDLKKNKRKITKNQATIINNEEVASNVEETVSYEITRACKKDDCGGNKPHKYDCDCNCNCECDYNPCNKDCEPCNIESKTCFNNPCGPTCCNPIVPQNFNVSCAVPYAIETNRVFDTMRFQIFTDATDENGNPVCFETEVVEVNGPVPTGAQVSVNIEKICINYDEIRIKPGCISLEDFDVDPMTKRKYGEDCQESFEYSVCGIKNSECCSKGKGNSVSYKQRGLMVEVDGLVLELRGSCGCTEFVALAYPVRVGSKHCQDITVRFAYNTLSAPICTPADGRGFTLRQNYQTSLTVDCIGKSYLSCYCDECGKHYELDIPNGIDVICCLQEVVSTLIGEQIIVLGAPQAIEPRIVDTFSKVCDFTECGAKPTTDKGSCGCN